MRIAGSYQYPTMETVIYGKPAAEALREEAERLAAKRICLIASRTLNTTADEIEDDVAFHRKTVGHFRVPMIHVRSEIVEEKKRSSAMPAEPQSE